MKKTIILLIALLMALSMALAACSNETPKTPTGTSEETQETEERPVFYGSVVVANLSNKAIVEQAGLTANVKYVRDASYSAMFTGNALKNNTTFPVLRSDFSGATYLEFNMYSLVPTATNLGLFLVSDSPETSYRDGYYVIIDFDFAGWKLFSVRLDELTVEGTPKGLNAIDSILFIPGYRATAVDERAQIHIEDIKISDKQSELSATPGLTETSDGELIWVDQFFPDTMVDYAALVKEKHPNKSHPRIVVNDEVLNRIHKYKDTDPFMKGLYQIIKTRADDYLETEPVRDVYYWQTNKWLLDRSVEEVAKYCGMMYLLTGEAKYAERIWEEVEVAANTQVRWFDVNLISSGHLAAGVALAYDWCYDYWNEDQLRLMRETLVLQAFDRAMKARGGGGYLDYGNNVVAAISKGYGIAALALCDEPGYEDMCSEFLNIVVEYLPTSVMHRFAPNGNYSEGSGYWDYTLTSFFFLTNAMKTACGTEGGLEDLPGLAETRFFPFGLRGPEGNFNYSSGTKTQLEAGSSVYFYLAERYNSPQLSNFRLSVYGDKSTDVIEFEDLLWYDPELSGTTDWRKGLPKDYFWEGMEHMISLRSSYESDANFIAAKGSGGNTAHSQPDAGSYVLDALGVRWIEDTGAGSYYMTQPYYRYYRERTEAHNCIVFDPERGWGEGGGQTVHKVAGDNFTPIVDSGTADGAAFAVLDLKPAYKETTTEYRRGFALVNKRTQFIVQDEFKTTEPFELYSYFHTGKGNEIVINPDGKSLTLVSKEGQMCRVDFITDIPNFEIGQMEAVHHSASPKPGPNDQPDTDDSMFHKFYLHAKDVKEATITVVFTPIVGEEEVVLPEILPLDSWDNYLEDSATLTGIAIDGIPFDQFEPGVGKYNVELMNVGTVTATAGEDIELVITQAAKLGEAAFIQATNKKTGDSYTYRINFLELVEPAVSQGVKFESIEAPHVPESFNPPENIADGDVSTRFASDGYEGEAQFTVDIGSSEKIIGFSISFYNGHTRKNKYKIEFSEDKTNWTTIFEGFTAGDTDQLINYDITPAMARYVRFTGYGCYAGDEVTPVNKWNSVTEFVLRKETGDFEDTKNHWAQADILSARKHSIVQAVEGNLYMPDNTVTRAEFISMMLKACGFSEVPYQEGTFTDVKADDWYAGVVMAANDKALIPPEMIVDGKLNPNQEITREEMSALAALGYSIASNRGVVGAGLTDNFKDLGESRYLSYIDNAMTLRLVEGVSADTFAPGQVITRADAAVILWRVYLFIYNVNN